MGQCERLKTPAISEIQKESSIQNDWNNSENEWTFDYHLYSEFRKKQLLNLYEIEAFQESPGARWDLWPGKLGRRPRIPRAKYRLPSKISWHLNSVGFSVQMISQDGETTKSFSAFDKLHCGGKKQFAQLISNNSSETNMFFAVFVWQSNINGNAQAFPSGCVVFPLDMTSRLQQAAGGKLNDFEWLHEIG